MDELTPLSAKLGSIQRHATTVQCKSKGAKKVASKTAAGSSAGKIPSSSYELKKAKCRARLAAMNLARANGLSEEEVFAAGRTAYGAWK